MSKHNVTYIPCSLRGGDSIRKRQSSAPDIKRLSQDKGKGLWGCSESWYKLDGVSGS